MKIKRQKRNLAECYDRLATLWWFQMMDEDSTRVQYVIASYRCDRCDDLARNIARGSAR